MVRNGFVNANTSTTFANDSTIHQNALTTFANGSTIIENAPTTFAKAPTAFGNTSTIHANGPTTFANASTINVEAPNIKQETTYFVVSGHIVVVEKKKNRNVQKNKIGKSQAIEN